MRSIRLGAPLAVVLAGSLWTASALAQSEADRATARHLGQQGQEALDAKDYKKSEDAFRRADGLYHAPTLVLGLARAQAAQGKVVEAWENYHRVILEAVTTTPVFAKALEDAKKEIGPLEDRRSRVTINVSGADAPRVTLDDIPVKPEALGVERFVDAGSHVLKASADGFAPATKTFSVGEGKADVESLTLVRDPNAAAAVVPPAGAGAPMPGAADNGGAGKAAPVGTDAGPSGPRNHTPALIAFGVGGVGLVVGAVTGGLALGKHGTLANECTNGACSPSAQSDLDSYHSTALLSTIGFIVGGVGVAAGAVLWFTAPKTEANGSGTAYVAPYVGPGTVGAVGRF